jgi:hypothetical protein
MFTITLKLDKVESVFLKEAIKLIEQHSGNATDTVHISLLTWSCTNFCLMPPIQLQSFEWARTSSVQPVAEFQAILFEEHFQVASEVLEAGICFSL